MNQLVSLKVSELNRLSRNFNLCNMLVDKLQSLSFSMQKRVIHFLARNQLENKKLSFSLKN